MRDQPLPRPRAAGEEGQRRAHVARRVVEGAAQRQLLVVKPVRVDGELASAEEEDGAARPDELQRVAPRRLGAGGLDHDVRAPAVARLGAEELRAAADCDRPRAEVGDARAQHQPDRPEPEHGDGVAGLHLRPLDAVQAAGERLDERGLLRREPVGHEEEVDARDPLRDEDLLRIGAVQERERLLAERLLAAAARRALRTGSAARRAERGGRGGTPSGRCRR